MWGGVILLGALAAREYLTINLPARKFIEGFNGWLIVLQFLTIYPKTLAGGSWFLTVCCCLFSLRNQFEVAIRVNSPIFYST